MFYIAKAQMISILFAYRAFFTISFNADDLLVDHSTLGLEENASKFLMPTQFLITHNHILRFYYWQYSYAPIEQMI